MVRITAKSTHNQDISLGSGTLIAKKTNYGFVITNWHVIRDSNGFVTVKFPDSKTYEAAVVAVDDRWDLALVVISEPKGVEPVVISPTIPKIGETYWVAGYRGDGTYRIQAGRFIQFQAPEKNSVEAGLIEIGVPSESGDSGGPIFNAKSELAGVLFGSTATTVGSHCGRVFKFLEDAAPNVMSLPTTPEPVIKAASLSGQSILQRGVAFGSSATRETRQVTTQQNNTYSSSVSSSMSFGGSGIRTRGDIQEAPSRTYTRRELHGFLNIEYDLSVANTLLVAERRTGTNSQNNTQGPGNFILAGSSTQNSAASTPSDITIRNVQPITRTGIQNTPGNTASSATATDLAMTRNTTAATTTTPVVTSPTTTAPGWGNPSASYSQSFGANATPAAVETLPVSSSTMLQTAQPRTAGASPAYGDNANDNNINGNTNIGSTFNDRSSNKITGTTTKPAAGMFANPNRRETETTPNGTRGGTDSSTPNGTSSGATSGGRTVPTSTGFNTYSQTTQPTSSSSSRGSSLPNDFASQYALDSSDMQMDDEYAPKYADEYVGDSPGADVTGVTSKYDAIKIVIAILVIFFILFHTIKTMAVAEERQKS